DAPIVLEKESEIDLAAHPRIESEVELGGDRRVADQVLFGVVGEHRISHVSLAESAPAENAARFERVASDLPGDFLLDIPLRRVADEIVFTLNAKTQGRDARDAAPAQLVFRLLRIRIVEENVEPRIVHAVPAVACFRAPGRTEGRVGDVDAVERSCER